MHNLKKVDNNILNPQFSNFLDLIRWVAALLVVIHHVRTSLMVEHNELINSNIFIEFFYFITSIGAEAVIIFFVLSGFLVGGKVIDLYFEKKFEWKQYLINRISRLYVVLIPALIIGLTLDIFGNYNFHPYYINQFGFESYNYNVEDRTNGFVFLVNLFMLQISVDTELGSNGPLWSLAFEFWYYIIFPIILEIFFTSNILKRILLLLIMIGLFYLLSPRIFMYFIFWIIGVGIYFIMKNNFSIVKPNLFISIIFFIISLVLSSYHVFPIYKMGLLLVAIATAYLIYSVRNKNVLNFPINERISEFSFTLYLFHAPLLLFLLGFFNLSKMQPSNDVIFIFFIFCIILYLYSFLCYFLFEKHTNIVRNKLKKIFYGGKN